MDILIASGEYNRLMSGLNEMFASICDYTHDRCLKLLLARGKVRSPVADYSLTDTDH